MPNEQHKLEGALQTEDDEFVPGSSAIVSAADISDAGTRLDRFLASRIETLSRARLQDLIREGHVRVSGHLSKIRTAKCEQATSLR